MIFICTSGGALSLTYGDPDMRVEYCKEAYEDYEDEDYEDLQYVVFLYTLFYFYLIINSCCSRSGFQPDGSFFRG